MTSFTITVDNQAVQDHLKALSKRAVNMQAVLQTIGEGIVSRNNPTLDAMRNVRPDLFHHQGV